MQSISFDARSFPPHCARLAAASFVAAIVTTSRWSGLAAPALTVVYPSEGASIPSVTKSFAFGAAPPGAHVTVNGIAALVAPDGGWIAYLPFSPGTFVLHVTASLDGENASIDRTVDVAPLGIAAYPWQTVTRRIGDDIPLAVQASDGDRVTASGPGFASMTLAPAPQLGPGAFASDVVAHASSRPQHVHYRISHADGSTETVASGATLEISSRAVSYVGAVVPYAPDPDSGARPYGMLAPQAGGATDLTMAVGTPLAVTGRDGAYARIALGTQAAQWIDIHELERVRAASAPSGHVIGSSCTPHDDATQCAVALDARLPYRITEIAGDRSHDARLRVDFYSASQRGLESAMLPLSQRTLWGYRVGWSGDELDVWIRRPPAFAAPPAPALRGFKIVIDPGHAPDTGAVGPLGTVERDVNLDIALRLRAKIRALGADVIMTRVADTDVKLYDRPRLAETLDADALISVHNNAWPDGVNPATHHGFTIYYYQPHSVALAQSMHAAYASESQLPDQGVQVGDLALVRSTQMPSVLTESAFISWPPEEMRLRDPAFRDRLAKTMADGFERWAEQMRATEDEK